jgi:hypothetical protein
MTERICVNIQPHAASDFLEIIFWLCIAYALVQLIKLYRLHRRW